MQKDATLTQTNYCRVLLVIAYIACVLAPLVLALVFGKSSDDNLLHKIGVRAGLASFMILVLQVVLSARFRFLDRVFGIDKATYFHKVMGISVAILLLAHPVLMAAARGSSALFAIDTPWQINLGKLALLFAIAMVSLALMFEQFGLDYNVWRFSHKCAILILIFGFAHSILIGSDLQSSVMSTCWWGILIFAAAVFLYRNFYVPLWARRYFEVTQVRQETHNTYTLTLKPKDGRALARNPGQFMFLKLKRPGRLSEIHPFTISASSLRTDIIEATIKKSGNFTNTIDQTRPGDTGLIEAPFGRFSLVHCDIEKFLFIAGGVGITPIMSMLRYLRDTGDNRPALLLYGNRTENDIIFRDEIDKMPQNVKIVHVISLPEKTRQGPKGHINIKLIQQYADDFLPKAHIFVCGPVQMMESVISSLKKAKIPGHKIHYERFTI